MAYKHVIRAETKNLMTDEMFISAGFTKQPDGSWYVPDSVVLNNKVMWENTEGIAGPITMSFYGRSSAPYYAGVGQWLVEAVDGTIAYRTPTGTSSEWVYGTWSFDSKTVSKVYWVNISNRPLYLRDVMFEWGSTPTPYTPYNYLQSNKRMIKVSDVCQLVPISDRVDTVIGGVTFTNNHDGSWTISGTSSEYTFYRLYEDLPLIQGHVYLNTEGSGSTYVEIMWVDKTGVVHWGDNPYTADEKSKCNVTLLRLSTATDTIKLYPQFFDLTEMFGAGHEPATVAEFRQRFPNEYYPYSPQCWLTSYKSAVVCKTKNLFDVNKLTAYTPETLPKGTAGVYNGVIISKGRIGDSTCSTGKTLRQLCPDLIVGETYTLNFETTVPSSVGGQYESIHLRGSGNWWRRDSKVITESDLSAVVYIYAETDGAVYMTYNLQIEQGSTATSYVPYQHL